MRVTKTDKTPTKVLLLITAEPAELITAKHTVLQDLAVDQKIAGFRTGKAPLELVEKQLDPQRLQTEFLDRALSALYLRALQQTKLRPVAQPQVSIKKFVPFTTLEFEAEVEAVGEIILPDYKKIKLAKPDAKAVTTKEVDEVIARLRKQAAAKQIIVRAAKNGDETWIDFKGVDAKTKEPISGADGSDYPLILGSNSFIPGFESNLIGLKAGEEKTFILEFPADYGVKALQSRKVSFTVTIKKVEELKESAVDDAFAAKVGPFKTVAELKADIKKQLAAQAVREAEVSFENELITNIAAQAKVVIPDVLIDEELQRMEAEERRNLTYRGQTWAEHLVAEGVTEEEHRTRERPNAELRVKTGLVLGDIAQVEQLDVTPEELEIRIQLLKGQHDSDEQMQAELEKPENRRDIASRLLTEKTISRLTQILTDKT